MMTEFTLKGETCSTLGKFLKVGELLPDFVAKTVDLEVVTLINLTGKKIIYTLPSLDTEVCLKSVMDLNQLVSRHTDIKAYIVSNDTPFAARRILEEHKLSCVQHLSVAGVGDNFGKAVGVQIASGPLKYLLARAVIVADEGDKVIYSYFCPDITVAPDFAPAIEAFYPSPENAAG